MPPTEVLSPPPVVMPSSSPPSTPTTSSVLIIGSNTDRDDLPSGVAKVLKRLRVPHTRVDDDTPSAPIQLSYAENGKVLDVRVRGTKLGSSDNYSSVVLCCTGHPALSRSDGWGLSMLSPQTAISVLRSPTPLTHMANDLPLFIQLPDCRPCWSEKLLARLQAIASRTLSATPYVVERQVLRRAQQMEQVRLQSVGALQLGEEDLVELQQDDDLELRRPAVLRCTVPQPTGDRLTMLSAVLDSICVASSATPSSSRRPADRQAGDSCSPLSALLAKRSSDSPAIPIVWLASEDVGDKEEEAGPLSRLISRLAWFCAFDGVNRFDLSCEKATGKTPTPILQQIQLATAAVTALSATYLAHPRGSPSPITVLADGSATSANIRHHPASPDHPALCVLLRDVREVKVEGYAAESVATLAGIKLVEALTHVLVGDAKASTVVKSSLQYLSFANSPLLDVSPLLKAIANVVKAAREELTALSVEEGIAVLDNKPTPPTARTLRSLVYPLCPLSSLNLSGCRLPLTSLCYLLSQCPTLTQVTLDDPIRVPRLTPPKGTTSTTATSSPNNTSTNSKAPATNNILLPVDNEVFYSGQDPSEGARLLRSCRRYVTHISMAGMDLEDTPEVAGAISELLQGIDCWTGVRAGDEYAGIHIKELKAATSLSGAPVHPDHSPASGGVVSLNLSRNSLGRYVAKAVGEALLDARRFHSAGPATTTSVTPSPTSSTVAGTAPVRRFQVEELDISNNDAMGQESLLFLLQCAAGSTTLRSIKMSQKNSIDTRIARANLVQPKKKKTKGAPVAAPSVSSPTALPAAPTVVDLNSRAGVLATQELRALLEFFMYNSACGAPLQRFSFTTIEHEKRCVETVAKVLLTPGGSIGGSPLYGSLRHLDIDTVNLPHLIRCDLAEQCVGSSSCDFRDASLFPHLTKLGEVISINSNPLLAPPVTTTSTIFQGGSAGTLTDYHVLNTQVMVPVSTLIQTSNLDHESMCVSIDDGVIEYTVKSLSSSSAGEELVPGVIKCLRRMATDVLLTSLPPPQQISTTSSSRQQSGFIVAGEDGEASCRSYPDDFTTMSGLFSDVCVYTGPTGYMSNVGGSNDAQPRVVISAAGGGASTVKTTAISGTLGKQLHACGSFAEVTGTPSSPTGTASGVVSPQQVLPSSLAYTSPHGSYFVKEVMPMFYAVAAMPASREN